MSPPDRPLRGLPDDPMLQALVDTIPDGLFTVNRDARITRWNPRMEEITGYRAAEVLGQHCSIMQGDACVLECSQGFPACSLMDQGEVRDKRCRITRRDGTRVEVVKNARLLRDPSGQVIGGVETVTDITTLTRLEQQVEELQCQVPRRSGFHGIIGHHPVMTRMYDLISMAARSSSSVLIQGETGTGKELVAAAVHHASARARGPLVKVSCAALSESLLESELFGHVRGAFTGAVANRQGRFEAANGGTLFLDEIGDVSMTVQTKLLRALQEQEVERVGSNQSVHVDIRVVAATNRDLIAMCDQGLFRRDLYYRLAVIPIAVPPLRERRTDISLLADHFVRRLNQSQGRQVRGFSPSAMARLEGCTWPGNVRELEHAIEYAFVVTQGALIDEHALPMSVCPGQAQSEPAPAHRRPPRGVPPAAGEILAALEEAEGRREEAAARLGVSRMTLWKWMKALGVEWPPGSGGLTSRS